MHYKAMLITLALHLILLMFELLVCDKLQSGRHLWILVFIPLIFISIVSIAVCIWAVKHDRSFEVRTYFIQPYLIQYTCCGTLDQIRRESEICIGNFDSLLINRKKIEMITVSKLL